MKSKALIIFSAAVLILLTIPPLVSAGNESHINKLGVLAKEIDRLVQDLRETNKSIFDGQEKVNVATICDEAEVADAYFSDLSLMITLYDCITDKKKKEYANKLITAHAKFVCGSSVDFAAIINFSLRNMEHPDAVSLGHQIRTKIREAGDYVCVMELK